MTQHNVITIDGPAASGKSSLGQALAKKIGFLFFDTGIMYRAITWGALHRLKDFHDEEEVTQLAQQAIIDVRPPSVADGRLNDVLLDGEDITWQVRDAQVEAYVSDIAAFSGVRIALAEQQRRIGLKGNVVMVGRDIGTVVMPDAALKIYLDASAEERARRRHAELESRGDHSLSLMDILDGIRNRDQIDSNRKMSPLKPAPDAVIVSSDDLTQAQVVEKVMELIPGRITVR